MKTARALLVVCSYRGGIAPKPAAKNGTLRAFIDFYRDFYANPRAPLLQRQVIERVLGADLQTMDIRVDDAVAAAWPDNTAQQARAFTAREARGYSRIVLAYPDPLGLTWGALERRLGGVNAELFVLNGRGRLFALTPDMRSALGFRRFLAASRIGELAMACLVVPFAGLLSLYDAARGRT